MSAGQLLLPGGTDSGEENLPRVALGVGDTAGSFSGGSVRGSS